MRPSFLDDPKLNLPQSSCDAYPGSPGRSNETGASIPSMDRSEPPEASPQQARGMAAHNRENQELYVKGSLVSVISQLTGQYVCYTFR